MFKKGGGFFGKIVKFMFSTALSLLSSIYKEKFYDSGIGKALSHYLRHKQKQNNSQLLSCSVSIEGFTYVIYGLFCIII